MPVGVAPPVGMRVGFLWLPVCLVSSERGLVWRPGAVAGWVTRLGGGAAGWRVRRVVLCGALGSWGAVGAAGICALTLVGWRGGVCVQGWALNDVPHAYAVSLRLPEGLLQVPEDVWVVLGRGEVAGVDSQGVERIGQHGFPCGLRHPAPRQLEAAVLCRPLAGPLDQALEGGVCPGPLSQLPELRVGPVPPPLSLGGAVALGGGDGRGWVRCGRGDWGRWRAWGIPRSSLPWECAGSGGAGGCGLAGMRTRSPPQGWVGTRGGGGSGAFAVCGLTWRVGRGVGTLLVDPGAILARWMVVNGPGVWALRGGRTKCVVLRARRALP